MSSTAPHVNQPAMRIRVRWFAVLRERRGTGTEEVDVPEGTTAAQAYARLTTPDVPVAFAVNTETTPGGTVLREGDEVAFLPPVGGG